MSKKSGCEDGNSTVAVITSGLGLDSLTFLQHFIQILLSAFSGKIYVITARVPFSKKSFNERVYIKQLMPENKNRKRRGLGDRIIKDILVQLKISFVLLKERKANIYIFFLCHSLLLPVLTLKLMKKKVIILAGSSYSKLAEFTEDHLLFVPALEEKITFNLSDNIVVYSENVIEKFNLEKHKDKILVARRHFIDFDTFRIRDPLNRRDDLVGYIGRLSREKGILNFLEAIPKVLETRTDIRFFIGGDGPLRYKVEEYLKRMDLYEKVDFVGWITRDELPEYMNRLKLFVIPSYNMETGPQTMAEAIACGTPVLATPVGSVPDVIKDGETGFIMENNSPECIAENVIRALNYPNIYKIVRNAQELVENVFTYEAAVERYRKILESI